jgi:hypothetical protein
MKTMLNYLFYFSLLSSLLHATENRLIEISFDTPKLYLLENNITLTYQARSYISKKSKKIKYYEEILYQSKKQKKILFEVKHYRKVKYQEEKHPLLSLIKREERHRFITILKQDGIKYPLKLRAILANKDDLFFKFKVQYPYIMHLIEALSISTLMLLFILITFRKRTLYD